ncbi:efflux RND transporter periplasmic adaptor subunit [Pseudomonas gingeri]|uniref:Efflux RND transporter periplasmic adaptor subunit n=1 Tax=Pseudomonas gingeri TaxID=117681 RepID=A0A7Y7XAN5_9PSED|nr:efflux RND transporter periplasmic adaptor subunit [Pseudomonas gingeri]NWB96221.1 efflux RND transporter periplasmic adaptor subunit [Pseudomonas gingeri]NWD72022.1 efflux RND transporter periplasmic adaptor subunit [Pseudomonas gingeri]NWD75276.1 efflux RND transporter periplasmic adaptor subunit [Pseudomonas gingeri]
MKPTLGHGLLGLAALALSGWLLFGRAAPAPAAAPVAVTSLSVETVQPRREEWPQVLVASGALAPWQEAVISAETGSLRIASLKADIGDRVKKGQVLATLADDSVQAEENKQKAAVAQAAAQLQEARSNARRAAVVGQSGALSEQQLEEYRVKVQTAEANLASSNADLRSTRIKLTQTRIVAVDDGLISGRKALLGDVVAAGSELFRMIREGRIEWQAELDARQLSRVRVGQIARLELPGGAPVEGRVRLVSPVLDSKTSRGLVYVSLPVDSGLRAGMYASGRIELAPSLALTVPDTAVVLRDGRSYVFVLGQDMHVSQQGVEVGRRSGAAVEIVAGLAEQAQIVRSGGAFLSDGASVTLVHAEAGAR